jgi:prepilin-type processing-associated H-X9-DG protein
LQAALGGSSYNHNLGLNGRSCLNNNAVIEGAWTAGSRHSAGAHVAFVDGHVGFLKDSIALETWRAIGTRAGGEPVPVDQF